MIRVSIICMLSCIVLCTGCYGPRPYVSQPGYRERNMDPSSLVEGETPAYKASGRSWTVHMAAGIVRRVELPDGEMLCIQVTDADLPPGEYGFTYELNIGKFSRFLGSGFTRSRDKYYHARISSDGTDVFSHRGVAYRVSWRVPWERPETYMLKNSFQVTVEEIIP